ncbi:MAG: sulfotransferase [Chloroflexota bacterium]
MPTEVDHWLPMPVITGVARSGTTLLRLMLDAHPEVAIPAETHFFETLVPRLDRGERPGRDELFHTLTDWVTWPDLDVPADEYRAALDALEVYSVGAGLRTFYQLYARRRGKRRGGDKSPMNGRYLVRIQELLPEARFIHIIRDGRDVMVSLRPMWYSPGHEPSTIARYWRDEILRTRAAAAHLRDYLEIRYEDLLTDARGLLAGLCDFLDMPMAATMLAYHERARERLAEVQTRYDAAGRVLATQEDRLHSHRLTSTPPDASRIGRWRSELTSEEVGEFGREAGALLEELGYDAV